VSAGESSKHSDLSIIVPPPPSVETCAPETADAAAKSEPKEQHVRIKQLPATPNHFFPPAEDCSPSNTICLPASVTSNALVPAVRRIDPSPLPISYIPLYVLTGREPFPPRFDAQLGLPLSFIQMSQPIMYPSTVDYSKHMPLHARQTILARPPYSAPFLPYISPRPPAIRTPRPNPQLPPPHLNPMLHRSTSTLHVRVPGVPPPPIFEKNQLDLKRIEQGLNARTILDTLEQTFKDRYGQPDRLTPVSPQLATDMANRDSPQRNHIITFFRALAICHSVLSDRPEPKEGPLFLTYKAESPDEAALVAATCDTGFPFVAKGKDFIDIEAMGQAERYIPFNSMRKRMSVIVRNPQGRIVLYCKGVDSVIYERLAADQDPTLKTQTTKYIETFANGGLRTLCVAYRYLEEEEYLEWSAFYDTTTNSVTDRNEAIDKANEHIEHSLYILGTTLGTDLWSYLIYSFVIAGVSRKVRLPVYHNSSTFERAIHLSFCFPASRLYPVRMPSWTSARPLYQFPSRMAS